MHHEARRRLEDILDREIEAARLLSATLGAERSALTGVAPEAVSRCAAEKIELLATIERLESERRALCAADTGVAAAVAERWRALMELMAGCRTANEINGYIINVRRNQVRQLMDIVRGTASVTYGPQGRTFENALRARARA
jgi:flagellar biosynthesis/type III secretory pathway chaperone